MKATPAQVQRIERALRTIRQRIFDMPEDKAIRAGIAIDTLKRSLAETWHRRHVMQTQAHWMHAAE